MSSVMTVEHMLGAAVSATGTFDVPYASGFAQADFAASGTVDVSYSGVRTSCAWSAGASAITVTWPAGKPDLPVGTYFLDFDALAGDPLDGSASKAAPTTSLTDNSGGTAADTIAAIGGTYSQAEVANAVASLATKVNAIITALKNANLMES